MNEAKLLSNRGVLHAYRGELALAERDLNRALKLYKALGSGIAAAQVFHNLGYVSALRGDIPTALRRYDLAARPFADQGLDAPTLAIDRADLFLSAQLLPEARQQVELGIASLEAAGNELDLVEARLLLSQIAFAQEDLSVAASAAYAARRTLRRQGRPRWAAVAKFLEAQARWAAGTPPQRIVAEAVVLAAELRKEGCLLPSIDCRLLGARAALQIGDGEKAELLVGGIDPSGRGQPAAYRVRVFYAKALGCVATGNRVAALSALRSGLMLGEVQRATLGATELRVPRRDGRL